jgi:hypothetical protein
MGTRTAQKKYSMLRHRRRPPAPQKVQAVPLYTETPADSLEINAPNVPVSIPFHTPLATNADTPPDPQSPSYTAYIRKGAEERLEQL